MRRISALFVGVVSVLVLSSACKKDDPPPAAPAATQPQWGQPGQPGMQPQPGQPGMQPQPGQPGMQPQPGQPMQPQPGQLSTPGPTALPCQNDSQCMTHRCNTQYGKCAFPCTSDNDCVQGSTCFVGGGALAACLPKPPGQ